MKKLLLLDMDGTVRRPKSGAKFISSPDDQEIIPEAVRKIEEYHQGGWLCVGITNQGGVAAGHKTLNDAIAEQAITLALCPQIALIYFCPDFEGEICYSVEGGEKNTICRYERAHFRHPVEQSELLYRSFRKPGDGMLWLAIDKSGMLAIEVLMVGDRLEDEAAAKSANVPFLWAQNWWAGKGMQLGGG